MLLTYPRGSGDASGERLHAEGPVLRLLSPTGVLLLLGAETLGDTSAAEL